MGSCLAQPALSVELQPGNTESRWEEQWLPKEGDDWVVLLIQPETEAAPVTESEAYEALLGSILATAEPGEELPFRVEREGDAVRIPRRVGPGPKKQGKRYKPVAMKVKPTSERLPEEYKQCVAKRAY